MTVARRRLEQIRRWRQTAVWAPAIWFPVVVFALATGRLALALTFGLSGLVFSGVARAVVWSGRCPRCEGRFGASGAIFREIWDESSCQACGLSLFELRREEAR